MLDMKITMHQFCSFRQLSVLCPIATYHLHTCDFLQKTAWAQKLYSGTPAAMSHESTLSEVSARLQLVPLFFPFYSH